MHVELVHHDCIVIVVDNLNSFGASLSMLLLSRNFNSQLLLLRLGSRARSFQMLKRNVLDEWSVFFIFRVFPTHLLLTVDIARSIVRNELLIEAEYLARALCGGFMSGIALLSSTCLQRLKLLILQLDLLVPFSWVRLVAFKRVGRSRGFSLFLAWVLRVLNTILSFWRTTFAGGSFHNGIVFLLELGIIVD